MNLGQFSLTLSCGRSLSYRNKPIDHLHDVTNQRYLSRGISSLCLNFTPCVEKLRKWKGLNFSM